VTSVTPRTHLALEGDAAVLNRGHTVEAVRRSRDPRDLPDDPFRLRTLQVAARDRGQQHYAVDDLEAISWSVLMALGLESPGLDDQYIAGQCIQDLLGRTANEQPLEPRP
jgi:hypothetical protein